MRYSKILSVILTVFLVLPLITSCSSKEEAVINPKMGNGDATEFSGTMGLPIEGQYGGYLGYGYDIAQSAYFNSGDIAPTAMILDMDALVKDGLVYTTPKSVSSSALYMGQTLKTYQEKVSSQIGIDFSYGIFSKIKGDFSLSESSVNTSSSNNVYIKNQVKIDKERQYINTGQLSIEDLKNYTNSKVLEALNADTSNLSTEEKQRHYNELFKMYGTHILVDIIVGGRMDLNYVYNNSESKSLEVIRTEVNAAYSTLTTKVNTSIDQNTEKTATSFISKTSFQCTRVGGSVTGDITTFEEAKTAYKDWAESIQNNESLELIDVGDSCNSSLIGIWELADGDSKKDITVAYLNYLNASGQLFADIDDNAGAPDTPLYISNIYIGINAQSKLALSDIESQISHSEPGAPYKIIPSDLNNGVKGDYIYIGYTLTTDVTKAITDIKVEWWSKESNASSTYDYSGSKYHCIKKDLNSGAGGKYIYVYYTKDTNAGKQITEIGLERDGQYTFGRSAAGWISVIGLTSSDKADCNKGSGGPYIYLWFKR